MREDKQEQNLPWNELFLLGNEAQQALYHFIYIYIYTMANHPAGHESSPMLTERNALQKKPSTTIQPPSNQPVFGCPLFAMESVPGALLSWEQCSSCGAVRNQVGVPTQRFQWHHQTWLGPVSSMLPPFTRLSVAPLCRFWKLLVFRVRQGSIRTHFRLISPMRFVPKKMSKSKVRLQYVIKMMSFTCTFQAAIVAHPYPFNWRNSPPPKNLSHHRGHRSQHLGRKICGKIWVWDGFWWEIPDQTGKILAMELGTRGGRGFWMGRWWVLIHPEVDLLLENGHPISGEWFHKCC